MVHLVADVDGLSGTEGGRVGLIDGSVLPAGVAQRLGCDASFVAHLLVGGTEPLYLGRKVRYWSSAQRRAITVRDGGRCRFPGCERRINDIHHIRPGARVDPPTSPTGPCTAGATTPWFMPASGSRA